MKIRIKIDYILAIVRTNGKKRFHFYRNEYGVEAGWNIVPSKFGVLAYITRVKATEGLRC